jgi:hypothetical protein
MSKPLLATASLLYLGCAVSHALEHRWGMCVTFIAYAVANIGLMFA